jgi:tRNA(Ile)-lysidine synthase
MSPGGNGSMDKHGISQSIDLKNRITEFFQRYSIGNNPGPLLVAVSGGPDSVCLFHLLYGLQDLLGVKLHVVHLDHCLRGEESTRDASFVRELAQKFNIPATIKAYDVQNYRARHHLSLEEAAREVRYTFFADTAHAVQAAAVAVGHTRDDNIETILMHLIRGTGTRGLRGLSPITKWHPTREGLSIIRPLLEVSRQETEQYCRDHKLETMIDKSNTSPDFLRNRIRRELRPMLESYNPQINEALLKMAAITGDELAFLDDQVRQQWQTTVKKYEDTISFDKKRLLAQPPAVKRHLLRIALEELIGNLKDIETRHIEEMMELLKKAAGKKINLPYGLVFSAEYNRYLLGPEPAKLCPFPVLEGETTLQIPGETLFSGWRINARISNVKKQETPTKIKAVKAYGIKSMEIPRAGFFAYFDFNQPGDSIKLRSTKPGDRFQPFGSAETKKVNRFMIDARIPHDWRERIPIVILADKIAWVTGYRTDDRFKVTATTRIILKLQFRLQ